MKKGWVEQYFENCFKLKSGENLTAKNMSENGIYPVFGGNGIAGYHNKFNLTGSNVIIGRVGALCGNVRHITEKIWLTDNAFKIVDFKFDFDHSYLTYLLNYYDLRSYARQAAQPVISNSSLKDVVLRFPKSIKEQQRIVFILDEAFAAIAKAKANAEQNLKNAKELFESYLQGVFEKKGDGWEEKKLGEIATFRNGMNFTKSSKGEKIKIVGVKDFQSNFWIPFDDLESVVLNGVLNKIDELKEDDILAVRSNGNPALIGRTLLASEIQRKTSHSGFTIRIRLNTSNTIFPVYLCQYLKTQKTRKELVQKGNGVGIKSLNQGSLSSLVIPFPKSLQAQQAIVRQLDTLRAETQKLEAVYQKKIADLEELKKSILQKAFAGELRSPEGVRYDSEAVTPLASGNAPRKR